MSFRIRQQYKPRFIPQQTTTVVEKEIITMTDDNGETVEVEVPVEKKVAGSNPSGPKKVNNQVYPSMKRVTDVSFM